MQRALFALCLVLMSASCRKIAGSADIADPPYARAFHTIPEGWEANTPNGNIKNAGFTIMTHKATKARIGVYIEPVGHDDGEKTYNDWMSRANGWYGSFLSSMKARTDRGHLVTVFMVGPVTVDLSKDFEAVVASARVAVPN